MKWPKLLLGIALLIGSGLVGVTQAQAAVTIEPRQTIYHSNGNAKPIFSDAALTQNTGRRLDPKITEWQTFQVAVNEAGQALALDLGNNQWVDVHSTAAYHSVAPGSYIYRSAFSGGKAIQLYRDPQLTQPIGKLDTKISNWAITQVDFVNQSDGIYSIDLGHNQWASLEAFPYMATKIVRVAPNNVLVDQTGQKTGQITNTDVGYLTFDVKSINGQVYVKLGSDRQWINTAYVSPSLI
ncbi:hypothetical protein ACNAN0_12350 [Agrilactobacillus fermenti]|uniref:hypothetical protein n=1 Tax=Agrilactobacillus fermenti TaxID=2586909 RepID=UPI001E4BD3E1|nr:hypothetical protein [Agrilactobacillus fermenti]MCD2255908.1 hypothetical protein [Agrilactobacillus fermenti]